MQIILPHLNYIPLSLSPSLTIGHHISYMLFQPHNAHFCCSYLTCIMGIYNDGHLLYIINVIPCALCLQAVLLSGEIDNVYLIYPSLLMPINESIFCNGFCIHQSPHPRSSKLLLPKSPILNPVFQKTDVLLRIA